MTAAIQDFWLNGWGQASGGLPYITGTGSVDADFGFRFVFHGDDWSETFAANLLSAAPGEFTVCRYEDGPDSQMLVVGNAATLLEAATGLVASGAEAAALNILLGL